MVLTTPGTKPKPSATERGRDVRQFVSFSFYRCDSAWRRFPPKTKSEDAAEFLRVVASYEKRLLVMSYSLVGLKADVDFLLWRAGERLELLQEMSSAVLQTKLGRYLTTPYAFLSMTRRSTYVDKLDPDHADQRRFITPAKRRYLFVYPFVKTTEWYQLPLERRQAIMDEHIVLGNKYPSVRIHTTYSFGLDDQEFVLAFETDRPQDFLDLVMELRESKARPYTLRDTPIFTCVAKPLNEIVHELGA